MLSAEAKIKKNAYLRKWRATNSERVKAATRISAKAWRDKNKEHVKELKRRHYNKHKAKCNARTHEYYCKNKDKSQKWQAEYYQTSEPRRQSMRDYGAKYRSKPSTTNRVLKKMYGITLEEYDARLLKQDSKCAICGAADRRGYRLSVDHDHETGRVRGLLCGNCNLGLGSLKDDPELLEKAAAYIRYQ